MLMMFHLDAQPRFIYRIRSYLVAMTSGLRAHLPGRSLHSYFRKEIDYSGIASTPKIQRGALGGNSVTSNRLVQPISGLRGCGLG